MLVVRKPSGPSAHKARPRRMGPCFRRDDIKLLHQPVGAALPDRALKRRASMHARQPRTQIRIGCKLVEYFCHLADKAHLDIGAAQRTADKELPALQCAIDIAEMICHLAVDARMQGSASL